MITRKVLINKFVNFVTKGFELSQAINDEYKTIKKFKKDRNNAKEKNTASSLNKEKFLIIGAGNMGLL